MKVDLVEIDISHVELLRQWRNLNRYAFFNTDEITTEQHASWYAQYCSRQNDTQYIVVCDGEFVGTIGAINSNPIEIVRVMLGRKDLAGHGVMTAAINQLIAVYHWTNAILRVRADNEAAIKLYQKCGFRIKTTNGNVIEMSRESERGVVEAARRMGFDSSRVSNENAVYFDERALMGKPPARHTKVAVIGNDNVMSGMFGAIHGFGMPCDMNPADFREYDVAIARTNTVEAQRTVVAACAAGCMFISVDGAMLPYLDSQRDYVVAPLRTYGVTGEASDPTFSYANPDIVAALAYGVMENWSRCHVVAEDVRRIVFSVASSATEALRQLASAGVYDVGPFRVHCEAVEAANDMYMWKNERHLFHALLSTLKVDGEILEIGIGNGGTLSVLSAFSGGRAINAIDDFSYSNGDNQQRAVTKILEAGRTINLITSKSKDVSWNREIAFLHVDGGHDYDDANRDVRMFASWVKVGGVLAVDDYATRESQQGVGDAVDKYMEESCASWIPITCGPKAAFWRRVA